MTNNPGDYLNFFGNFLRNPNEIGSLFPSSYRFADFILDNIDLDNANMVVELGSGNGVFTRKIMQRLRPGAKFFALEINPNFVEKSRKTGATVYLDSALHIGDYMRAHNIDKCDCIVSGIPFSTLDDLLQKGILKEIHKSLRSGGELINYAHIQSFITESGRDFRKVLREVFPDFRRTDIYWGNLPPAFAYHCKK
jgi:phosphatidylethanolamine/phosphatidyl-N-methylethanolamine N-methyltransferase